RPRPHGADSARVLRLDRRQSHHVPVEVSCVRRGRHGAGDTGSPPADGARSASPATRTRRVMRNSLRALVLSGLVASACQSAPASTPPAAPGTGDAAFSTLATFILKDRYKRHPSASTDLGIHT